MILVLMEVLPVSVQKVLSGSDLATSRWSLYFTIRQSLTARTEPEVVITFWIYSKVPAKFLSNSGGLTKLLLPMH